MLLRGYITQLIRFYSLPQQLQVYQSQLRESRTLGRHYRAWRALRPLGLGPLVWALYGFRVAAQYYTNGKINSELAAFAGMPNHLKNIDYICSLSGGVMMPHRIGRTEGRWRRVLNMCRFALGLLSGDGVKSARKALRIISAVERRYGWVQALNISTFLFSVFSFRGMFGPACRISFTANDFAPVPLAFKYAGTRAGLRQIFTMHGQISSAASGNQFPRLDYDAAFLYGAASLKAYEAAGAPEGLVIFTGFPGKSMRVRPAPEKIRAVGICLANYFDSDTGSAIDRISSLYPDAAILVRPHPRMNQELLFSGNKKISVFSGSMEGFADHCDFVIAGNTGAQLDLLKRGCPVAHYPALDKLGVDDIGLVADETVMFFDDAKAITANDLNNFFNDGWVEKFRRYDALYLASAEEMERCRLQVKKAYDSLK